MTKKKWAALKERIDRLDENPQSILSINDEVKLFLSSCNIQVGSRTGRSEHVRYSEKDKADIANDQLSGDVNFAMNLARHVIEKGDRN